MKKLISLTLLALFIFCNYASARNIYDSTGRKLLYDGTIRGRKRAAKEAQLMQQQQKLQAAAAAKINYENSDTNETKIKQSNYIQSKNGKTRTLPDSNLKSNYIQNMNK